MQFWNALLLATFIVGLSSHATAQTGPGPAPSPWSYGPSLSIFYNNGEIDIGTPTGAGTLGPGWFNASGGFAVNGVALPGAFGSKPANQVYASPNGASGTPVFRPISPGDLPSSFAIPGTLSVVGTTNLGNAVVAGTLSVAGPVSGAGFANYMTAGLVSDQPGLFSTLYATQFGVGTSALVGDGATNNNTALQAALTAIASGGELILPCGQFLITAQMTVTIASHSKIVLSGSGANCTTIVVQGATGGIQISLTDETASFDMHDILMTTNQAGSQTAITVQHTAANSLNAYATPNSFTNVSLYGSDYPNSSNPTHYWGTGINLVNVNNVSVVNDFFIGGACSANLCGGVAINFAGLASASSYGVVLNVLHSNFGLCNTAIFYGDWAQGVALDDDNITGCRYGVNTATAPIGSLDQLAITNSQFNNFVSNINLGMTSNTIGNALINNNVIIVQANASGMVITRAQQFTISNNTVGGVSTVGTTGILIGNGLAGNVSDNVVVGMNKGIAFVASSTNLWTHVINNTVYNNTTDYVVPSTITGAIIQDILPRTIASLFSCFSGDNGSREFVSDLTASGAATYHGVVTGSGSTTVNSPAYCDGVSWKYD